MTGIARVGALLLSMTLSLAADAFAMQWQPAPQKHGGRMAAKMFHLEQGEGAHAYLLHPDLEKQPLGTVDQQGMLKFRPSGKENYHALVAVRESEQLTEAAIRYVFLHGKPVGRSPSELTHSDKLELEIVPNPLPREHWRHVANQEVAFLLRFRGRPLGNFPVSVSTSNGSKLEFRTDAKGLLTISVPDDFESVRPGRRNNPPAEWRIKASYEKAGYQFRTVYSEAYHADPKHWQPLSWGLAAVAGGMLVTGVVGFRRRSLQPPARSGKRAGKKAKE